MSDLPPPHTISAYTNSHPTKLKLKVPAPHHPSAASPPAPVPAQLQPVPGTLKIRAHHPTANGTLPHAAPPGEPYKLPSVPSSTAASPPIPPAVHPLMPAPVPAIATLKATAAGTIGPGVYPQTSYAPYGQYTHPGYQQPAATPSVTPVTIAPAPSVSPAATTVPADTQPPSDPRNHRTLKSVALMTTPRGRRLRLDHTDGVRTWAVRLVGETGVRVSGVRFLRGEGADGESSDEEPASRKADAEEEYDGGAGEKDGEAVKEKEEPKPEKRKRGRPPKKKKHHAEQDAAGPEDAHAKESVKKKGKASAKLVRGEVQVKLNGVVMSNVEGAKGEWELAFPIGPSVMEIGEKGGTPWKVYLDRLPV